MENNYNEWVYVDQFRSVSGVLLYGRIREKWSVSSVTPYSFPSNATYPPPFKMDVANPFFNSQWKGDTIGFFSGDLRLENWEKSATYSITFYRGNIRTTVFSQEPIFSEEEILDDAKRNVKLEQPLDPDPREIAWRIDQYLKGDPLENCSDDEKANLKTLLITLPELSEFEQGVEYALDFPRKLPDGTVPAEIRLVASRGEIQQVLDKVAVENPNVFPNPASLVPDIDGKYTVLFGQPDKQTVHCYHINEEGKCLAWGEIEVFVKDSNTKTFENSDRPHD